MPAGFQGAGSPAANLTCPCGGGSYAACCAPLISGQRLAETAEQLMRSRYSAFARAALEPAAIEHLLRTHPEPDRSPEERRRALRQFSRGLQWLQLEVLACEAGGPADAEGCVRFAAHWRQAGRRGVQRETSRFGRSAAGEWLYLEPLSLE